MPSTVNGIGTHYHGKQNIAHSHGVCQRCGFEGNLASYDTRLFFVVVFIPLLPLRRKRILNQCPRCSYHYVMPLEQWDAQRQLSVSGAADHWRTKGTPEAGIELSEALLGYQYAERAASLRGELKEKFPKNARLQEYLGSVFERLGDAKLSEAHFRSAHELRPDLPAPRIGLAQKHIKDGNLDDARKLLEFLEKPGASQLYNLGVIEDLGDAFQKQNRHAEALELFRHIIAELPAVVQHAGFRNKVAESERAVGVSESALKIPVSENGAALRSPRKRTPVIIAGAVCTLIAALGISNEWIRRNRTLWIVNGFDHALSATAPDGRKVDVPPRSSAKLKVAEGRFNIAVTGAADTSVNVDFRCDYLARWGDDEVRIVNPKGAAAIVQTIAVYSAEKQAPRVRLHFGEEFVRLPGIEYVFRELPAKLSTRKGESSRIVTSCEVFSGERVRLFEYLRASPQPADAMRFAEKTLPLVPDDGPLLDAYLFNLARSNAPGTERFLKSGIGFRPVSIVWHRHYQNALRGVANEKRLRDEYDAMLSREPKNAALIYLRGRVSETRAETADFFQRALRTDPKLSWASFALGYDAIARGDFETASTPIEDAFRLAPREQAFRSARNSLLFALGKTAELEKELQRNFNREPSDWRSARELSNLLASTGRFDEALKIIGQVERRIDPADRDAAKKAARAMEIEAAYLSGDLAATEHRILAIPGARNTTHGILSLLAKGGIEEAIALPSFREFLGNDAGAHMMVALAAELAGDTKNEAIYRTLAIQFLTAGDPDSRRAGRILDHGESATAKLDDVIIHPSEKSILCALLARRHADKREHYNALAKKLNLSNDLLVNRAVETP